MKRLSINNKVYFYTVKTETPDYKELYNKNIYSLYDSNKKLMRCFQTYADMKLFIKYGF